MITSFIDAKNELVKLYPLYNNLDSDIRAIKMYKQITQWKTQKNVINLSDRNWAQLVKYINTFISNNY